MPLKIKSLSSVSFKAQEMHSDGSLKDAAYSYSRTDSGVEVLRNQVPHLSLKGDYLILKALRCGICCTDLARPFLPYPLPQIIGHEVVVQVLGEDGSKSWGVVEINNGHLSHGDRTSCSYCLGMPTQCPARITMGINQWPGGVAPYLLVPRNNLFIIHPDEMSINSAVLIEPFAAALHGVNTAHITPGSSVAVLGAGKLGLLTILGLHSLRKERSDYSITAIARSETHAGIAKDFGVDRVLVVPTDTEDIGEKFDVVFDTTGTPTGFERAISIAQKEIHLKSTHGQSVMGVKHLTELVVDELALLPFSVDNLKFGWHGEERQNANVLVGLSVPECIIEQIRDAGHQVTKQDPNDMVQFFEEPSTFLTSAKYSAFDLGIANSVEEVDNMIRPSEMHDRSFIRQRGAILLLKGTDSTSLPSVLIEKNLILSSSRCGEFETAIEILKSVVEGVKVADLVKKLITHEFALSRVSNALDMVAGKCKDTKLTIKVIINCDEQ